MVYSQGPVNETPKYRRTLEGQKNVVPYLGCWQQKASYDKNVIAKNLVGIWAKTLHAEGHQCEIFLSHDYHSMRHVTSCWQSTGKFKCSNYM